MSTWYDVSVMRWSVEFMWSYVIDVITYMWLVVRKLMTRSLIWKDAKCQVEKHHYNIVLYAWWINRIEYARRMWKLVLEFEYFSSFFHARCDYVSFYDNFTFVNSIVSFFLPSIPWIQLSEKNEANLTI